MLIYMSDPVRRVDIMRPSERWGRNSVKQRSVAVLVIESGPGGEKGLLHRF
jgi:hypothetical protein